MIYTHSLPSQARAAEKQLTLPFVPLQQRTGASKVTFDEEQEAVDSSCEDEEEEGFLVSCVCVDVCVLCV